MMNNHGQRSTLKFVCIIILYDAILENSLRFTHKIRFICYFSFDFFDISESLFNRRVLILLQRSSQSYFDLSFVNIRKSDRIISEVKYEN